MTGERIREVEEEPGPLVDRAEDMDGCACPSSSARTVTRAQSGQRKDSKAPSAARGFEALGRRSKARAYFPATRLGGFQLPSPGGRIDGGVSLGQYSRITR